MTWFGAVLLALAAVFLTSALSQTDRMLSRYANADASLVQLAALSMPSVLALAIPLALPLGLTIGLSRMGGNSFAPRRALGVSRPVAAFVLLVCLLEGVLLLGIVPVANDEFRALVASAAIGQGAEAARPPKGVREMSLSELRGADGSQRGMSATRRSAAFELHKRFSIPTAALFLSLLGIALGVYGRRSQLLVTVMLAGAAAFMWFELTRVGASMVETARIPSWFGAWLPAGTVLLLALLAWWQLAGRRPCESA